ncbi:MAG: universal stress protein, partial [Bacteroidota bacterium]
ESHLNQLRHFAYPSGDGSNYAIVEPPQGVELTYEAAVSLAPSADILQRASQPDISLVVMATRSTRRVLGTWLGSTATTVSEACVRPVFLIPPKAPFSEFKRIVVANNHATAEPYPLWQLEGLADLYGAMVHFVHVEHPKRDLPLRFAPWKLMEQLVDEQLGAEYPFEILSVENKDIAKGLLEFSDSVNANLLVIFNQRRSRWHALLRATLTQSLALRAQLPVLVLHTEAPPVAEEAMNAYQENNN